MVVVYFPVLQLLKIRNLEEVLRILEELSIILQDFFKNFQGGKIDNYHSYYYSYCHNYCV